MKGRICIALAAGLLLSVSAESAVAMWPFSSSTKASAPARDSLSLTTTEQKTVWKDLHGQTSTQSAPSGFQATAGAAVPTALQIKPISGKAANDTPAIKPYDFAIVSGKLLIVNPSDRKIANVITG
jgi:hypothetical protein